MDSNITLVDSHCHLNFPDFAEDGIDVILNNAAAAGVKYAQTICTKSSDFTTIHNMALSHKNLFCSFGIHPHDAGNELLTVEQIVEQGRKEKVIGIGETGLDYYYNKSPKAEQIQSFKNHLEAARELDLPVIIHTRDAEEDTMQIISEALAKGQLKLLFHCFTASQKLADFGLKHGIYFSAPGIITFKKCEDLRATFATVPSEFLLVETDAPYLAPEPYRGKRNEPAYTLEVAQKLADIKQISLSEIAEITTNNFFNLFTKATR